MAKRKVSSPGDILKKYIADFGQTAETLAAAIGEKPAIIKAVLEGKKPVTAVLSAKLDKAFGTKAVYWYGLQTVFEYNKALAEDSALADSIKGVKRFKKAAKSAERPKNAKKAPTKAAGVSRVSRTIKPKTQF
jgi:addiction module HigA family antidote